MAVSLKPVLKFMKYLRLHFRWSPKLGFLLLAVVIWSGFSCSAVAEELSPDEEMLHKLFEFHSKLATQGNLESVVKLGAMYEHGEGVAKDRKRAIELYRYAADRGNKTAMELIANIESNKPTRRSDSIKIKVPTPKNASNRDDSATQNKKNWKASCSAKKPPLRQRV